MGYNGEDVRSHCDVCAVGSMWAASVRCEYSSLFTYGAHADAHNKSPVSGDGARSYGVVQDNFCMSELEAVWYMGDEESAYGTKGKGGISLPGQCSFHCTKPDSSAESTEVHALLHKDYEDCP